MYSCPILFVFNMNSRRLRQKKIQEWQICIWGWTHYERNSFLVMLILQLDQAWHKKHAPAMLRYRNRQSLRIRLVPQERAEAPIFNTSTLNYFVRAQAGPCSSCYCLKLRLAFWEDAKSPGSRWLIVWQWRRSEICHLWNHRRLHENESPVHHTYGPRYAR